MCIRLGIKKLSEKNENCVSEILHMKSYAKNCIRKSYIKESLRIQDPCFI